MSAWRSPARPAREWIALLEREGELVRIGAEVDPHLEVTEIVDRTVKAGGPALLFERPKGSEHPLLVNQFGTERRMSLAFGVGSLDDVATKLADVLEMQPPEGIAEKLRGLRQLKSIADSRPSDTGPQVAVRARRVIFLAARRSISAGCRSRPAGRATPPRSSPSSAGDHARDPHTGHSGNVGMYFGCRRARAPRARQQCTGSCTRTAAPTTSPRAAASRRRGRARSRPRSPPTARARRSLATTRRAHVRGLPSRRGGRGRERDHGLASRSRRPPRSCSKAPSSRAT